MGTTIGFIGTGTIASALVTGFCSGGDLDHKIFLSPRNAARAAELAGHFPNITVCNSNQEVVDQAEWVILAVVPSAGEEILRPLRFRPDQRVINLLSDRSLEEVAGWIGPTRTLVHLVPLSFAARRTGPIALYPNDRDAAQLFAPLGEIVAVDTAEQVRALGAITGLMCGFYTLLRDVAAWGRDKGLRQEEAHAYTTSFFEALSGQARQGGADELVRLAGEMTPGGLNDMALKSIGAEDGFQAWIRALDKILVRMGG